MLDHSLEFFRHRQTRLFAVSATLRANTAVFMPIGMTITFLATCPAGHKAGFQLGPYNGWDRLCLPGENSCGGFADIRAVEVETDASYKNLHMVFRQAGIGACVADIGAFGDNGNTGCQIGNLHQRFSGMSGQHLFSKHFSSPFIMVYNRNNFLREHLTFNS